MDTPKLNIGENIKKFRELKNMTREEIADRLDLSVSAYGKIERNETDVTVSRIQQIAEILQIEMSQILNFDVSQIFNISNNNVVQATGGKADNMHFYGDEYREKYIKMLETEVERLKSLAEKK
ncbi:MAG: XRE family transcriptional regulator [Chryseobacterium sp.]|nr:XRE family transcriptional regulator [Chryseobacterium sp.]